jgi:anaerobic ribonucleoside-triphosphate reductase activating protein
MRIAGIIKNDVVNGIGVCTSLFTQGCPHHCKDCFNSETWDFNGGYEIDINSLKETIIKAISNNGIQRNFSILGGEPLCPENRKLVKEIISAVREFYPDIKIFIWTGYELSELQKKDDKDLKYILSNIDYLIDGRFILEERDFSLWLRGSRNQNVYKLTKDKNYVKIEENDKGEINENY